MIELTDREKIIIDFALYRFMCEAYLRADKAAQQTGSAASAPFMRDAKDAEALLLKWRTVK